MSTSSDSHSFGDVSMQRLRISLHSHFALPMGSGTGASVVSVGAASVHFFFFGLYNRLAVPVKPCYSSSVAVNVHALQF